MQEQNNAAPGSRRRPPADDAFVVLGRDMDLSEALQSHRLGRPTCAAWCVLEITLERDKPENKAKIAEGGEHRRSEYRNPPFRDELSRALRRRWLPVARNSGHATARLSLVNENTGYTDKRSECGRVERTGIP